MDAQGLTHTGLEVALHRDEERGRYLFGVIVNGEFVPLVEHKLGRIDKIMQRAADRQSETQTTQPASGETTQPQQ